jgi:hypothetical protein
MMKIRVMDADDWKGLYFDDKLADEGHSFHLRHLIEDILNYIKKNVPDFEVDFKVVFTDEYDPEDGSTYYLEKFGSRCPEEWPEELP